LDGLACRIAVFLRKGEKSHTRDTQMLRERKRQATTGTLKCYNFIEGRGRGTSTAVKIL